MTARPVTAAQGVAPEVLKSVIEAYYPDAVRGGALARSRATAAQSASSLLVGAFVGLVSITAFAESAFLVRGIGFLAAMCWTATCVMYLRAVSAPIRIVEDGRRIESPDEIVRTILDRSKMERDEVDKRQTLANGTFIVALIVTGIAIFLATFIPQREEWKTALFHPTPDQLAAVELICPVDSAPPVLGKVDLNSLASETLTFRMNCRQDIVTFQFGVQTLTQMVLFDE